MGHIHISSLEPRGKQYEDRGGAERGERKKNCGRRAMLTIEKKRMMTESGHRNWEKLSKMKQRAEIAGGGK